MTRNPIVRHAIGPACHQSPCGLPYHQPGQRVMWQTWRDNGWRWNRGTVLAHTNRTLVVQVGDEPSCYFMRAGRCGGGEMSDVVERAKAALEGVTPAPWHQRIALAEGDQATHAEWLAGSLIGDGEPLHVLIAESPDPKFAYIVPAVTGDGPTSRINAEFIAAARDLVPELVAEVGRLRIKMDLLRGLVPVHPDYRPLYAEKRCGGCGYWRGQHLGNPERDDTMYCPATTFTERAE